MALGGVYNVYRGGDIVIELADEQSPAEVVRTVLDMGHELALPMWVFMAKKGLDDRVVVRRLEEQPDSGRGVLSAYRERRRGGGAWRL